MYKNTSERFAVVFAFDEYLCKQYGTLALQNPSMDAYNLAASTILSDQKVDQK